MVDGELPGQVSGTTLDDYTHTIRLHLGPALGHKRLAGLTVGDVGKLWAAKRDAGYKLNTVRIMRAVLRRALAQAERERLVTRNVAALSQPATASQRISGQLLGQEALQFHNGDGSAPAQLDRSEPALAKKPVDGIVPDIEVVGGHPGGDRRRAHGRACRGSHADSFWIRGSLQRKTWHPRSMRAALSGGWPRPSAHWAHATWSCPSRWLLNGRLTRPEQSGNTPITRQP
jgi:hypothetical protein